MPSTLSFESKLPPSSQKLRGSYYTPSSLASYLAKWAIRDGRERILEPSSGDGNFVVAALDRLSHLARVKRRKCEGSICAVEIDPNEWKKAQKRIDCHGIAASFVDWRLGDFFRLFSRFSQSEQFDVVLGNPPFI